MDRYATDLDRARAEDRALHAGVLEPARVGGVRHAAFVVLVDEAHRSQEGDLGRKMRRALPNAFLFGLTGTPINRADRNTFFAFGAEEDEYGGRAATSTPLCRSPGRTTRSGTRR